MCVGKTISDLQKSHWPQKQPQMILPAHIGSGPAAMYAGKTISALQKSH